MKRTAESNVDDLYQGILARDRASLGRAITLIESSHPERQRLAHDLLTKLRPHLGDAYRIGITGVPGSGKSTFIDQFATNLTQAGHRVAVLAVDPSSTRTGGSILADKTRMPRLANDPQAFVRPSPSGGVLGGVTRTCRETLWVLEAAGFGVLLVETVGVGQSEVAVHAMVDFFVVLTIAGAGDAFQGIKKGVLELADLLAVNKADGDNADRATAAAAAYRHALRIVTSRHAAWHPPVVTCSGLQNLGLDVIWSSIDQHRSQSIGSGALEARRREQDLAWIKDLVNQRLMETFWNRPEIRLMLEQGRRDLEAEATTPGALAEALLAWLPSPREEP